MAKPSIAAWLSFSSTFRPSASNTFSRELQLRKTATWKANVTFIAFPLGERQRVVEWVRCPDREHSKPMPEGQIAQGVQLLDLMLKYFADDGHWTRGQYDDGNGGHCLVGALLHLSRKHRLPRAAAIALLQDAMPRPGLPLVHFNDACCASVAELRSIILKARRLADDHAERERADAAVKAWLLDQIGKQLAAPATAIGKPA